MKCKACGKEIDEHEAGIELDFCIMEKVLGWIYIDSEMDDFYQDETGTIRHDGVFIFFEPSINISDAWEVVELDQFNFCQVDKVSDRSSLWNCTISNGHHVGSSFADTAPLAICLAALEVVSS